MSEHYYSKGEHVSAGCNMCWMDRAAAERREAREAFERRQVDQSTYITITIKVEQEFLEPKTVGNRLYIPAYKLLHEDEIAKIASAMTIKLQDTIKEQRETMASKFQDTHSDV